MSAKAFSPGHLALPPGHHPRRHVRVFVCLFPKTVSQKSSLVNFGPFVTKDSVQNRLKTPENTVYPISISVANIYFWIPKSGFRSHTGRIACRQQLAEIVWLVSLGCSGGSQRSCRVFLHIIQLGWMENPYFEKWPIFPICMWKWGESAPCGKARLWQPNGPQYAKSHAVWQSPSSRTEKLRFF